MKIRDIFKEITTDISDYELRMSCMTHKYTIEHPESSHCINLYQEDDYSICVDVDWRKKSKTLIGNLLDYDQMLDLISWDIDDGNMIEFNTVIVCNERKWIILAS